MRVAVVGHVEWVDFVPVRRLPVPGEVIHAQGAFTRAGGGGGVAAAILAEMGAEVDFFCVLGRDTHGEAAAAELEARGVHAQVAWRDKPTRRAVTLLEHGGERTIVTIGERLDPLGDDELDWDRLRTAGGVYFTAGDAGALARARQARELVATPRARHALEGEGPKVDALVFSAGDRDESKWAARVADRARLLVVTDGPRGGSWFGESEGTWQAAPLPGTPRDSYGCGDSFAAAFMYGLASGSSVAEAAALGAKWGAKVLTRHGAP
jgi:ribokinase